MVYDLLILKEKIQCFFKVAYLKLLIGIEYIKHTFRKLAIISQVDIKEGIKWLINGHGTN